MRKINEIIIHCSDSKWGNKEVIDKWHIERGFDCIGYHFVVLNGKTKPRGKYRVENDGLIENGRDIEKSGAHCIGHNALSIGICLIGVDEFSPHQLGNLLNLLEFLCGEHDIPYNKIHGHYEFSDKSCPNFDIDDIRDIMKARL